MITIYISDRTGLVATTGYAVIYHQDDDMPEYLFSKATATVEEAKALAESKHAHGHPVEWRDPTPAERQELLFNPILVMERKRTPN